MSLKIKGKLLTVIISTIIAFSVIVNLIIYFQFNNYVTSGVLSSNAKLSLQLIDSMYPGEWKLENSKLYKGDKIINDDYEIVDEIKKESNIECTIFLKDTRISTTIIKDNKRAVGTKADEKVLAKVLSNGSEYIGSVDILNVPYKTIYMPIKSANGSTIGMFFAGIEQDVINSQVNNVIFPIVVATILLVIVMAIIITIFATQLIIKPIKYIKEQLHFVEAGDLSIEVQKIYLNKKDEFGEMTRSIKVMQDSIKGIIKVIYESSGKTDIQSHNLAAVSEEISSASASVASTIQNISNGVDSQTEELVQVSETLDIFGHGLDNIKGAIENVNYSSKEISTMANKSNDNMINLSQSVNNFSDSFRDFMGEIKGLGESIKQIKDITTLINDIAEQTNLLALNAAIEAARAGEAGRGFNVVAEEIRKLSEQTKASSEEISKLIESVNHNTNEMVDRTSVKMDKQLDTQIIVINSAIESFKNIITGVNEVIPKMNEVTLSTQNISKEKEKILEKVSHIGAIAQELSSTFEEITASAEEMTSSTEEVANVAQTLNGMTNETMRVINNFKF